MISSPSSFSLSEKCKILSNFIRNWAFQAGEDFIQVYMNQFSKNLWILRLICGVHIFFYENQFGFSRLHWRDSWGAKWCWQWHWHQYYGQPEESDHYGLGRRISTRIGKSIFIGLIIKRTGSRARPMQKDCFKGLNFWEVLGRKGGEGYLLLVPEKAGPNK